jgi:carbonic anhydrase
MSSRIVERLIDGNRCFLSAERNPGDFSPALRRETAENGQRPHSIVICCSDSRVVPESVFSAGLGELFVIRVAGNVLDAHQLGSIEYAAAHLGCRLILVLGHTGCGAVSAALSGHSEGYIRYITDEVLLAVGGERDPDAACRLNVLHAVERIRGAFREHPEIPSAGLEVRGAVYDIRSGEVVWL